MVEIGVVQIDLADQFVIDKGACHADDQIARRTLLKRDLCRPPHFAVALPARRIIKAGFDESFAKVLAHDDVSSLVVGDDAVVMRCQAGTGLLICGPVPLQFALRRVLLAFVVRGKLWGVSGHNYVRTTQL